MLDWLGISAINPWLLIGAAGIASPIIIHLLSRRRFKIIDWAAMDFLLDAEQRNRRRIKLEHLILLLLRCLALLLLAFLVSRLFVKPGGLASFAFQSVRTEHIFVLDDSPSMELRLGNQTVFDNATDAITQFVKATAKLRPNDTFSLKSTSHPDRWIINGRLFSETQEIIDDLKELKVEDMSADFDSAITALEEQIDKPTGGAEESLNRIIYIVTDMRLRDWTGDPDNPDPSAMAKKLGGLSKKTNKVVVVNVGTDMVNNLAVVDIKPLEKNLAQDVATKFEVVVANFGSRDVTDVKVNITVGNAQPIIGLIDRIPAGQTGSELFNFTFSDPISTPIIVEIAPDQLPADNQRIFVAQVKTGLNVLLVDGDPSSIPEESETFFLRRAIAPGGQQRSGFIYNIMTENQFLAADLSQYQVIYLSNVYHISDIQRDQLEQWVSDGGGLVICLGDQVDEQVYANMFYRDGEGLMPIKLTEIKGDITERNYVNFLGSSATHPIMRVFEGESNPFRLQVKFFRWWHSTVEEKLIQSGQISIIEHFNNDEQSPAIIEQRFGQGRVITITSTVDRNWNSWAVDPSYLITMQELTRHIAQSIAMAGNLTVGQPISFPLDLSKYQAQAMYQTPGQDKPTKLKAIDLTHVNTPSTPDETVEPPQSDASAQMVFYDDQSTKKGIYHLELNQYDGEKTEVLFAANINPSESDLTPTNRVLLAKAMRDANVELVNGADQLTDGAAGGRAEMWRWILVTLIVTLCIEQYLAWTFGRRR